MSTFWFQFGTSAVENKAGAYLLTAALHQGVIEVFLVSLLVTAYASHLYIQSLDNIHVCSLALLVARSIDGIHNHPKDKQKNIVICCLRI